jgi:hypothetical protein
LCSAAKSAADWRLWVKLRQGSKSAPLPLFPLKTDMR